MYIEKREILVSPLEFNIVANLSDDIFVFSGKYKTDTNVGPFLAFILYWTGPSPIYYILNRLAYKDK